MIKSIDAAAGKVLFFDGLLHLQNLDGTGRIDIPGTGGLATKQKYPRLVCKGGIFYAAWTDVAMAKVFLCRIAGGVPTVEAVPVEAGYNFSYPTLAVDGAGNVHMVLTRWRIATGLAAAWAAIKSAVGLAAVPEQAVYYFLPAGGSWVNCGILEGAGTKEYKHIAGRSCVDSSVLFYLGAYNAPVLIFSAATGQRLTAKGFFPKPAGFNPCFGDIDIDGIASICFSGQTGQSVFTLSNAGKWQDISGVLTSKGTYDIVLAKSGKYLAWYEKIADAGNSYRVMVYDGSKISAVTMSAEMSMDCKPSLVAVGSVLYCVYSDNDKIIAKAIAGSDPIPPDPPAPPDPPTPPGNVTVTFSAAEIAALKINYEKLSGAIPGIISLCAKILGAEK